MKVRMTTASPRRMKKTEEDSPCSLIRVARDYSLVYDRLNIADTKKEVNQMDVKTAQRLGEDPDEGEMNDEIASEGEDGDP